MAKAVLSTDRDNLALWDGYARLERQRQKVDMTRQVYVTAIQAAEQRVFEAGDKADDLRLDINDLWAAWAEMEWEEDSSDRCLEVVVMAAGFRRAELGRCQPPATLLTGIDVYAAPTHQPQRPPAFALLKAKQVSGQV